MMEKMKKLSDVMAVFEKNKDMIDPAMYERLVAQITRDTPNYYVGPIVNCEECIYRSQYSNDDGLYACGVMSTGDMRVLVPADGWCHLGRLRGTTNFPDPNLSSIADYDGLKWKYIVFKCDTGELVDGCFVLRPDKDEAAIAALVAYAGATGNKQLAADILAWIDDLSGGC